MAVKLAVNTLKKRYAQSFNCAFLRPALGGAEGIRTPDLLNAMPRHSAYRRVPVCVYAVIDAI